ncbi:putative tetratricopeptide-like helical domain-containing protein [Medicago truncatula]|uniref:Pentatricopeptide (PPR) repeat protein n=1 Tax=Medicago truncatula TaxID=3880 RepID=A0A072U193_MEDTR|nr:pentatricopeptide repeat-containing protein At1g10270 [Medicago truncatula]KEH23216.1 pentatricopeptide (PPR) repeat protein [Medicago truncatula]RHN46499.1 putative tetratricopeptide-like helical domain-containing protein [Medicago truncatula]
MSLFRHLLLRRSSAVTLRSFSTSSAQQAATAEPQPPPEELHTRVTSLIRSGNLDAASAMARQSAFSATNRPTVFTCNAIIGAMHRAKRHNEALDLYEFFFNSFKITPNIVSYNFMINAYCDEGCIDAALDVFRKMKADASIKPSLVTYQIITKCMINAGRIEDASDIWFEMLLDSGHTDSSVYNNLTLACSQLGNLDKANEFIDELKIRCPYYHHGVVSATYMNWFLKQGRDKDAMECYKSLLNRKCRMRPETGDVLLEVLLKYGKKTEAWDLFHDMLDNHTPSTFHGVDSDTFTLMVEECLKLGKVDEALATLKKVGTKPDSKPFFLDVDGYCQLISIFCAHDMLSEAENLFQDMYSMSMTPDASTYAILFDTYRRMGRKDDAYMLNNKMAEAELIKNGPTRIEL